MIGQCDVCGTEIPWSEEHCDECYEQILLEYWGLDTETA